MNFTIIDPVALDEVEQKKLASIMVAGNVVLKSCYEQAFLPEGDSISRSEFRKKFFDSVKNWKDGPVRVAGTMVWSADIKKILEVKKHEYRIIQGVSKFMLDQSRKWKNRTGQTVGDNYNDAVTAVISAIYGYADPEIKFCTYAAHAILNKFKTLSRCNKPTSHWTNDGNKLFGQYQKLQQIAEQTPDKNGNPCGLVSFGEMVEKMKLSDKERLSLQAMLAGVIGQTDMQGRNDEAVEDYTANRKGIDHEKESLDCDQLEIIKEVTEELDDWEKAVLKAFLEAPSSNHGWRTIVANENVNPATGRAYSRAAPSLALERVKEKILSRYKVSA